MSHSLPRSAQQPANSSDTITRLLDTAERLFAEHGFRGTSLRELTSHAGANLAAVNYHFGSKEALFEAVFARRFAPINAERLRLLADAEARHAGSPIPLESWVEAMVGPPLRESARQGGGNARFLALLGRMHSESGDLHRRVCEKPFAEVRERFLAALTRTLPELTHADLFWRLHFVIGAMANTMASQQRLAVISRGLCDASDAEETIRRLVPFLAAGMRASTDEPAYTSAHARAKELR